MQRKSQKNIETDVLEFLKSQHFFAHNYGERKVKGVSKSCLHLPFFFHFAPSNL